MGSVAWATATAHVFIVLAQEACAEVAKPEWWNDDRSSRRCRRGW